MQVTDADIEALKPKDKTYKHYVGYGLFVQVRPDGKKYWRIKYRYDGKENTYSAGVFPRVPLAKALATNEYVKNMLMEGKNPNAEKKRTKITAPAEPVASGNLFQLSLVANGGMIIEANNTKLALSPTETNALRSFLAIKSGASCA